MGEPILDLMVDSFHPDITYMDEELVVKYWYDAEVLRINKAYLKFNLSDIGINKTLSFCLSPDTYAFYGNAGFYSVLNGTNRPLIMKDNERIYLGIFIYYYSGEIKIICALCGDFNNNTTWNNSPESIVVLDVQTPILNNYIYFDITDALNYQQTLPFAWIIPVGIFAIAMYSLSRKKK